RPVRRCSRLRPLFHPFDSYYFFGIVQREIERTGIAVQFGAAHGDADMVHEPFPSVRYDKRHALTYLHFCYIEYALTAFLFQSAPRRPVDRELCAISAVLSFF